MRRIRWGYRAIAGAIAIVLACPWRVIAQHVGTSRAVGPESATVAAGERYEAGAIHRWFSGSTYRALWATPIRVPLLNLNAYAGGLRVLKEGGGMQTKSLRFETAEGSEYAFRLTDKFVTSGPKGLQHTPMDRFLQDEVSAYHPAGAQIAAPIVDAAGVLHQTPVFMVMPDDSALGKLRGDFVGRLGIMVDYPKVPRHGPGLGGATKIIDSEELLKLLNTDPREHVDERAFLMARLTDFLINDPDRHPGQWKWARLESGSRTQWEPIALDRDQAFSSYNGVLLWFARYAMPALVSLGDEPTVAGLTYSRGFDARLLAELEKPVWDSVARALQGRITDSVVSAAAHSMPREYQASASALEAVLRARRDAIPNAANEYYRMLAERVDVHATDGPDRAAITRAGDGLVDVRLESGGKPYFARRFDARETSEILVYLHGGDDTAVVSGHVGRSIVVRVIGGNGTNTLLDSSTVAGNTHPTRLYDSGVVSGVSYGPDTTFDRVPWEMSNGRLAPPAPNAGTGYSAFGELNSDRRIGLIPLLGIARYQYGFDHRPYSYMVKLEGEYATQFEGGRVRLSADKRLESSPLHLTAIGRVSDFEDVNYSGLGNATSDSGGASRYYEVHQRQWLIHPAIALAAGPRTDISLGPVFQHSVTDSTRSPYLLATHPYGFGTINQAAMQLTARYDWLDARDEESPTRNRVVGEISGLCFPAMMDVRSPFEEAMVSTGTALLLPLPTQPYLIARVGGKKVYGDFPFYEAATIGAGGTTRYMYPQRYAGDASLYGTSELRIPVARFQLVVPWRAGILGVAEGGRVYEHGSSPGGWHTTAGGGLWLGFAAASPVVTFTRTTEAGQGRIQVALGLTL